MPRTILIHLNVTLPDTGAEHLGVDEVTDAILAAIEVGSDAPEMEMLASYVRGDLASGNNSPITVALAEEI